MDAAGRNGSVIETAAGIGLELMASLVVVAKQILTARGMAEGEEQVLIADRNEAGAGPGVT